MTEKRVLVTGGSGYVGSTVVPIVAKSYPVVVLETMTFGNPIEGLENTTFIKGDIRDEVLVPQLMKEEQITDIIHLAAIVTDDLVDMNPEYAKTVNEDAMKLLCRAGIEADLERFVYASSSSIYGTQDKPCTEESIPQPMTAYAQMKLNGETILEEFADSITTVSVRSATACGPAPRMRFDTIINVFCKQAFFDREINVHGGDQWRTNIHVKDVAELYRFLLDANPDDVNREFFNASYGNHKAIDLAAMVRQVIPAKLFVDRSKSDNRHYRMDSSYVTRKIGWKPGRALNQAIKANRELFLSGKIDDPDDSIWYNTKRMEKIVKGEKSDG